MKGISSPTKKRAASTVEITEPTTNVSVFAAPPASKRQATPLHHDLMIHRAVSFQSDKNELEEQLADAFADISLKEKEIGKLKNHLELLQVALAEHQGSWKRKVAKIHKKNRSWIG